VQELLAVQNNGPKAIAFFGTRNMGFVHQALVETLAYAIVLTGNHVYTSGGLGTNAAVVRGALRAEKPDKLTVVLPQSLEKQPEELHDVLREVQDLRCMSENDGLQLFDASRCGATSSSLAGGRRRHDVL
jgi:predicted Rossmann-fold nucleotide-binding protein